MRCREARTALRRCAHVACPRAADLVQRDRGGSRGAGRCHDDDQQAPGAVYVPAQLRAAADGYTGRDQSPVHRARRRVLGVVSRRGLGVQDHHQTQWGDGGSAGRRRRHAAVVQRACGEPVTGADRQKLDQPDVSGCPHRIQDPQRDGRVPARLWRGRRLLASGCQQQLHEDARDGDGGGQERSGVGRRGGRPVPSSSARTSAAASRPGQISKSLWTWANTSTAFPGVATRPGDQATSVNP